MFFIATVLGGLLYLNLAFRTGCEILSACTSVPLYSTLERKLFKTDGFPLFTLIILSPTAKKMLLLDLILSDYTDLIDFQSGLLAPIFFHLNCCSIFCLCKRSTEIMLLFIASNVVLHTFFLLNKNFSLSKRAVFI